MISSFCALINVRSSFCALINVRSVCTRVTFVRFLVRCGFLLHPFFVLCCLLSILIRPSKQVDPGKGGGRAMSSPMISMLDLNYKRLRNPELAKN